MADKKVLISISNMKKYFPLKKTNPFQQERLYVKANDGITINIYEGETFGLVGESGCGKSTMGRVLLQLIGQTDGHTMYYGRSRAELAPKYVEKLLSRIDKALDKQRKLNSARDAMQAQYNSAATEREKWALEDKLREAHRAADAMYTDIVKIMGGLIVMPNPSEGAGMLLEEHHATSEVYRASEALRLVENELSAMLAIIDDDEASPASKRRAKKRVTVLNKRLEERKARVAEAALKHERAQSALDKLRAEHANDKGYAENQALLDGGIDLSKLTGEEMRTLRKDLQLIFQDPYSSLNPRMTVGQIISEGLLAHNAFHKNSPKLQAYVMSVMEKCGLAPYMLHRYPHQFSGGQRQRIGIARSLALNPRFVVCDEAVSALDVSIQSQILNLLQDLKEQQNLTYMFISHDLSVIKYISDRIGVMYLGNIVELAPSDKLFANPLHPYTEALLAAIPTTDVDAPRDIVPIEGDIPSPIKPPSGCKFHTRCKYACDICKQVTPELCVTEPEHFCACHRVNDKESYARSLELENERSQAGASA